MENKKISTVLAVGIILIVAIVMGGLIWLDNKQQTSQNQLLKPKLTNQKLVEKNETTEKSFCEITNEMKPNDKIEGDLMENKDWNKYINYRDNYQIDYPIKELSIVGNNFSKAPGGYWSALIGYSDRLGAYGDIIIHCGNINSAVNAFNADIKNTNAGLKIINEEKITINNMDALIIYSKLKPEIPTFKTFYIQYKKDMVLIISGYDEPMFDKMVETISSI